MTQPMYYGVPAADQDVFLTNHGAVTLNEVRSKLALPPVVGGEKEWLANRWVDSSSKTRPRTCAGCGAPTDYTLSYCPYCQSTPKPRQKVFPVKPETAPLKVEPILQKQVEKEKEQQARAEHSMIAFGLLYVILLLLARFTDMM